MQRRQLLKITGLGTGLGAGLAALGTLGASLGSSFALASRNDQRTNDSGVEPLQKSKAEWQQLLSKERFYILFEEGTERPHSSALNKEKRDGTYICAACKLPLFESKHKYESGTGWPSFFRPIKGALGEKTDYKLFYPRREYHCARCGGHQGHVFKDGPRPTGLRYCNNGLALEFVAADSPLPALVQ